MHAKSTCNPFQGQLLLVYIFFNSRTLPETWFVEYSPLAPSNNFSILCQVHALHAILNYLSGFIFIDVRLNNIIFLASSCAIKYLCLARTARAGDFQFGQNLNLCDKDVPNIFGLSLQLSVHRVSQKNSNSKGVIQIIVSAGFDNSGYVLNALYA